MASITKAASAIFRDRDFFVHDGRDLRRFRISAKFQIFLAALLVAMVAWSSYAAARIIAPAQQSTSQQVASLAAAAELRARQIEQRQDILVKLLAGEQVDAETLVAAADLADLPTDLQAPLARAEESQALQAQAVALALEARYRTAAAELKKLGITPARLAADGVGGPFEAVGKGDPTFKQLFNSWKKLDNLQDGAIAVPSDKPVKDASFTSGYGVRSDPFRRAAAMHAGIDLAGPSGTPIYATADGVVKSAGWNSGGYGNLIEIDHGRGIQTRYGHLSKITVSDGARVKRGDLIGRMGSTGRSTGSHLHYEVRIDGRAVNPVPFMKSTDYLVAMQRNAGSHSMDQIALGGPEGGRK